MPPDFKPYLIRAMYEWIADKGFSPYLAVAVNASCKVPMAYVREGHIVLDISMDATHELDLGNEFITFQARFGGVAQHLIVPINRVLGIFPEHDQSAGAFFEVEDLVDSGSDADENISENIEKNSENHGKPLFSRVK